MTKEKNQIFLIHGGMTFKNRKDYLQFLKTREISLEKKVYWSDKYLEENLGDNFEIIRPKMPLKEFARYEDWKIHFERLSLHFKDDVILIGVSLGGIFLAKYLSENKLSKRALATFLICPPFDDTLTGEDLVGGFKLKSNLNLIEEKAKNVFLMFSKDDDVVPVSHAEKYRGKLKNAEIIIYESKNGHFRISEFPEIIGMLKSLI